MENEPEDPTYINECIPLLSHCKNWNQARQVFEQYYHPRNPWDEERQLAANNWERLGFSHNPYEWAPGQILPTDPRELHLVTQQAWQDQQLLLQMLQQERQQPPVATLIHQGEACPCVESDDGPCSQCY